jgi:nucleoside-diphosphate-sugar epimerase
MAFIDRGSPVMITGGSGYIASWIVKKLLDQGYTVQATVRDRNNRARVGHLRRLASKSPGRLRLFEADLLAPGSFEPAMAGCELVIHCASPYSFATPGDPEAVFIRPAVEGTTNVLESANRTETVKRVVLTSSVAALWGDDREAAGKPNGLVSETDWNETSSPQHLPYAYSKTMAEKKAWEMARQQARWDLVALLPGYVYGPSLSRRGDSQSTAMLLDLANGQQAKGTAPITRPVADVRDVAAAHLLAGFSPEASGRYIIAATTMRLLEVAQVLRGRFGDGYPFPRRELPKALLWLLAPSLGTTRKVVAGSFGYSFRVDNARSRELGVTYRPVEETFVDHFQQILDDGLLAQ